LELHVFDPNEEHIYSGHRSSALGGRLNVDMQSTTNAVEIISFNATNPGTYTCKVSYWSCGGGCLMSLGPISYNVAILQGPNNDWHYYSGVLTTADHNAVLYQVATFTVA
jgi:hypothetical protein